MKWENNEEKERYEKVKEVQQKLNNLPIDLANIPELNKLKQLIGELLANIDFSDWEANPEEHYSNIEETEKLIAENFPQGQLGQQLGQEEMNDRRIVKMDLHLAPQAGQ